MTTKRAEPLEKQLDSYGAIARGRSRASRGTRDNGQWLSFAAAAGASLAGSATAEAAINWIVPPSPIRIDVNSNAATYLDLDGDSFDDFRFGAGFSTGPIGTNFFL